MNYEQAVEIFMRSFERGGARGHGHPPDVQQFSKGEMFALNMLVKADGPMTAGALSRGMNLSSARVAAVLGKLEEKKFVERAMDISDRRKIVVSITDSGRTKVTEQRERMKAHLITVFKKLGKQDTEDFVRLLAKVMDIMNEIGEECKECREGK
ncbi:MAG: MarR family winged helix-turn-helix transcriptional regulator [Clostridiales Family XIII bacterium]|jgi:DNA-binding MarR family transcriptional regulator|nr:MarR family winged helix-turn-helix transcriptional regulator [Clostridiales Family XIII bacterium]